MNETEVDDVAFLTGESGKKRNLYRDSSGNPISSCSKTQALCITSVVLLILIVVAVIAAFARPFPRCSIQSSDDSKKDLQDIASFKTTIPMATNGELFPWTDVRLPTFILPLHYDLFMHPNLTTFQNQGIVNITFQLTEEVDFVILHVKQLNLTRILLFIGQHQTIPIEKHLEYSRNEQLYIKFGEILTKYTNYTLHIKFEKLLEERLEGFYISSYTSASKKKSYLATTHFEPTAARSAFPCFDEPSLKATFRLFMVHEENHKAFFNTAPRRTNKYEGGIVVTEFARSLNMSTYLVAFVVCDFEAYGVQARDGVYVSIITPRDQHNASSFALNVASEILGYYSDFFNVSYPMSKLDLIAVPDFGAGAMENWGLITFRMTTILLDARQSSAEAQERVATVIAHELAHQWFGNLVTMQWWNDLWLNEGFASFIEYYGVNFFDPKWKMLDQFVLTMQDALKLDSLETSHAIMTNVENPLEIEGIFDTISYKKGASVIRMLESCMGMKNLRKGLYYYLQKYKFKNANTQDLWDSFTKGTGSNVNIANMMETWTKQKNYPLITVELVGNMLRFKQRRFVLTQAVDDEAQPQDISPFGYKWMIPVTYKIHGSPSISKDFWMNMTDATLRLDSPFSWIKVNVNQTGFYRVLYDRPLWDSLITALHKTHEVFSIADRSGLLDDAMTLSSVGLMSSKLALNLTIYLQHENQYVPWQTAMSHFFKLEELMYESPEYLLLKKYVIWLLKPVKSLLGWKDIGGHLERKLRSLVLGSLIHFEDEKTIKDALDLFQHYLKGGIEVSPDLKSVIYGAVIKHGSLQEWEFFWKKYQDSTVPSEKRLLLSALGSTRNIWQLMQFLNYSLDKNKIKPQDTVFIISAAAKNPIGRLLAWHFVRINWKTIIQRFGQGSFSMDKIISSVTTSFNTRFDYEEVKNFFHDVDVGSGVQAVQQSLEKIRANIYWRENVEKSVSEWLKTYRSLYEL